MKKIIFILTASLFTALIALQASAQNNGGATRPVSGFNGVEAGGPFNVFIKINGTESLKLDVDDDVLADIKTEVVDGTLKIQYKNSFFKHRDIKRANIYITAKSLEHIGNAGSGNMEVTGVLTGQNAKIALSGSGNISAAVKSGSLNANISGSGNIGIKGSTGNAEFHISGSGNIEGNELKTESVSASIAGSGSVSVIANKTVSARIAGSGSVDYSGNATIGETHYAGSGRVSKVD